MRPLSWSPRADHARIETVDAHAEGEPLRVIVGGFPQPRGRSVLARRRDARARADSFRTALMWEPRGHADMYGCLLMPPVTPEASFAVLFMHNAGFSTMCGHGIIAVSTVAVEAGLVPRREPETRFAIDTPAGLVRVTARLDGPRVSEVRFLNVPSFVAGLDERVDVPGLGSVRYDLAYGGAFYAFVSAEDLGLPLVGARVEEIVAAGRAIKGAVSESREVTHPEADDLGFLYGTVFVGPPLADETRHSRHVCVFADGEVDRSPTGTAVSGRLAILHARGALRSDEEIVVESLIGSRFSGRIDALSAVGPHRAVIPEVGGRAFITGRHEFVIDPSDPWREGFLLR